MTDIATPSRTQAIWAEHFTRHRAAVERSEAALAQPFETAVELLAGALRRGGTVFFCGNGGSAADAQHLAAELTVRFVADRPAMRSMTLAADTSALTACGNDLGFDRIFARQLEALGRPGDALVAITTSGNSANVIAALDVARRGRIASVLLTGGAGGRAAALADAVLAVPAPDTAAIQEMHVTLGHALCHAIEWEVRP